MPVGMFPEQLAQLPARERKWFRDGYPPNVVAHLSQVGLAGAASVKPGQSVRVTGIVKGHTLPQVDSN